MTEIQALMSTYTYAANNWGQDKMADIAVWYIS